MIPITSAEVYAWFFVHLGVLLVAAAWMTVAALMSPNITRRCAEVIGGKPWRSFFLGVILFAAMNAIPFAGGKFIAVVIGLTVILFGLFGAGGFVRCLASRATSGQGSPTVRSLYGISLLVALTWLLPLIGWFLALPLTLILGLGSLVLSRSRKPKLEAVGE
jgi:hypothetical protein